MHKIRFIIRHGQSITHSNGPKHEQHIEAISIRITSIQAEAVQHNKYDQAHIIIVKSTENIEQN